MPRETENDLGRFLDGNGWRNAKLTPIAGDMSSRRYFRVSSNNQSCILMAAEEEQSSFLRMSEWLRSLQLSAPEVFAKNAANTLLLLEDFGDESLQKVLLKSPDDIDERMSEIIDLLLVLRSAESLDLPIATAQELVEWTRLPDDYYPGINPKGLEGFRETLRDYLVEALRARRCTSLRDFHSQNIHWLPKRAGLRKLGLLDYQDAFLTHPAYDLMSVLTDARYPVSEDLRDRTVASYLKRSGDDPDEFQQAFFAFSAQRNLRVLGIFARAKMHLDNLPLTYQYFAQAVDQPMFSDVRNDVLAAVPAPSGETP